MQSIGAPNTGKLQRCWSGFRGSQNNAERAGAPVQQQKEGELGVFTLEERKMWGDFIEAFQYLKGVKTRRKTNFLHRYMVTQGKGNGFKPKEGRLD